MATTLDILIQARDQATSVINGVGSAATNLGSEVQAVTSKTSSASVTIQGWAKQLGSFFGVVAGLEFAKKSLQAFDNMEKAVKTLEVGLDKIHQPAALDEITKWASDFADQTGILEGDILTMSSRLVNMGSAFFKAAGPQAAHFLEVLTADLEDMAAATGKSVDMLMRSLGPAILNTPEKAIPLLQKLGVLTDDQATKIKKLTDAGKNEAATEAELNAIQTKFGGTAARTATAYDKLGERINKVEVFLGGLISQALGPLIPLLDLAQRNAGLLLAAFLGYKAIGFLPTVMAALETVISSMLPNMNILVGEMGSLTAATTAQATAAEAAQTGIEGLVGPLQLGLLAATAFKIGLDALDKSIGEQTQAAIATGGAALDEFTAKLDAEAGKFHGWLGSILTFFVPGAKAISSSLDNSKKKLEDNVRAQQRHVDSLATTTRANMEVTRSEDALVGRMVDGATATQGAAISYDTAARSAEHLAAKQQAAADAAHNLWTAQLQLAGGFLGVEGAVLAAGQATEDYHKAQKAVNDLAAKGKKGTLEYHDALMAQRQAALGATTAQAGLVQSVKDYVDANGKSKATTADAIRMVRDFGAKAGLTKADINLLVSEVKTYIGQLGKVPKSVKTEVAASAAGALAAIATYNSEINKIPGRVTTVIDVYTALHGGVTPHALGGHVNPGEPYLVGERGPELFASDTPGEIIPHYGMASWMHQHAGGGHGARGGASGGSRVVGDRPIRFVIENWGTGEGYIRSISREDTLSELAHRGL